MYTTLRLSAKYKNYEKLQRVGRAERADRK